MQSEETKRSFCFANILWLTHMSDFSGSESSLHAVLLSCAFMYCKAWIPSRCVFVTCIFAGSLFLSVIQDLLIDLQLMLRCFCCWLVGFWSFHYFDEE